MSVLGNTFAIKTRNPSLLFDICTKLVLFIFVVIQLFNLSIHIFLYGVRRKGYELCSHMKKQNNHTREAGRALLSTSPRNVVDLLFHYFFVTVQARLFPSYKKWNSHQFFLNIFLYPHPPHLLFSIFSTYKDHFSTAPLLLICTTNVISCPHCFTE